MAQCYDPQHHPDPPWECKGNPPTGYYVLRESNRSSANCVQYLGYKLLGQSPQAGDTPPVTETGEIEQWLKDNGFTRRGTVPCAGQAPEICGCGEGQLTNCAVVYWDTDQKQVYHVAAFDPELCDWGGKLSGGSLIERYKDPGDYCRRREGSDKVEMRFYCKDAPRPRQLSDSDFNTAARERFPRVASAEFKRWLWAGIATAAVIVLIRMLR